MFAQVQKYGELYQSDAVVAICDKFGLKFTHENGAGNLAISRDVLTAFRALSDDTVVWVGSYRYWRLREKGDQPGRQQD